VIEALDCDLAPAETIFRVEPGFVELIDVTAEVIELDGSSNPVWLWFRLRLRPICAKTLHVIMCAAEDIRYTGISELYG
jgi:hypothetical protein